MPTWEKGKAKEYYDSRKDEFKVIRRRKRLEKKKQERLQKLKKYFGD